MDLEMKHTKWNHIENMYIYIYIYIYTHETHIIYYIGKLSLCHIWNNLWNDRAVTWLCLGALGSQYRGGRLEGGPGSVNFEWTNDVNFYMLNICILWILWILCFYIYIYIWFEFLSYPVVNGGGDKRSELWVSIFPTNILYSMGSRLELLGVSQPSDS